PVQLVLGLGQPAGGQRRPLCVEGERLALRKRRQLAGVVERDRTQPFLLPDVAYVVGRPDDVGPALERRDEVVRSTRGLVVSEVDLDELAAALGRRVDRRLVDLAQGTLGERREDADLLDLVAEELDPERLATGGRKDVDEPPAHGELAALLDP